MLVRLWAPYCSWSLGRYCEKAFKQLGHSVAISDFRARSLTDADLSGDLVFVIKGSSDIIPFLTRVKVKKALWFPDDPHGESLPVLLAPYFDYIFTGHKPQVEWYNAQGLSAFWLPFACDPDVHRPFWALRKYDFVFIGNLDSDRQSFFEWLSKSFSVLFRAGVFLEDMSRAYCSGGIGINISKAKEITMRVFEIMACNVLLFTDSSDNCISDLGLLPEEHFVVYSRENVINLGKKYLCNGSLQAKIARNGYELVRECHTYKHRMQELLRICFG